MEVPALVCRDGGGAAGPAGGGAFLVHEDRGFPAARGWAGGVDPGGRDRRQGGDRAHLVRPVASGDRGGWADDPRHGARGGDALSFGGEDFCAGEAEHLPVACDGQGGAEPCGVELPAGGAATCAPHHRQGREDQSAGAEEAEHQHRAGAEHAAEPPGGQGGAGGWAGDPERQGDPVRPGGQPIECGGALHRIERPLRGDGGPGRPADKDAEGAGGAVTAAHDGGAGTRLGAAADVRFLHGCELTSVGECVDQPLCESGVAGELHRVARPEADRAAHGGAGDQRTAGPGCARAQLRGDAAGCAAESGHLQGHAEGEGRQSAGCGREDAAAGPELQVGVSVRGQHQGLRRGLQR